MSPGLALAVGVGALATRNVVGGLWLPEALYVPVNLLLAAALVTLARSGGSGADDLGMRADRVRHGVATGAVIAVVGATAIVVGSLLPWVGDAFQDQRAAGIGLGSLLYQVLVRIPIGTALTEEVAFRGVVYGLGVHLWHRRTAALISSVLFGLWHLAPTTTAMGGNAVTAGASGLQAVGIIAGAAVLTGVAGLFLVGLRLRSGSILAPIIVHAVINSVAFATAALRAPG